jgi:hypothetical protein
MVNELGITREDIKDWTMQSVKETVEKELRGVDIKKVVYDNVRSSVNNDYRYESKQRDVISSALREVIEKKLDFSIKFKEESDVAKGN